MYKKEQKTDIVIDIETVVEPVTLSDVQEYMKEYVPPSNYKDPAVILRHKEKTEAEAVEKISQERRFSIGGKRMISCALGVVAEGAVSNIQSFAGDDLTGLCSGVVDYLNECGQYRLIGWNHKSFDLPEIAKSFRKAGVAPFRQPGKWDLIDLCEYPLKRIGLKEAAKAFGLELLDVDGSSVAKLYAEGDWAAIKAYNEHDIYLTGEIFLALSTIYSFG